MNMLESYLNTKKKMIKTTKISENIFKIEGVGKNATLKGKCTSRGLDVDIVSKAGKSLYPVKERFNSIDEMKLKLDEVFDVFAKTSNVKLTEADDSEDLERRDEDEEILLDDADREDFADEFEDSSVDTISIESFSDLRDVLTEIADKANSLVDIFNDDDTHNKAITIGIVSEIYSIIDDVIDFMEDLEEEAEENFTENESVAVAGKTSYLDLAKNGLNQAHFALEKIKYDRKVVQMLEDIKSEIAVHRK